MCPVYRRIGGHAYDAVYSGPMGAVLTPLLSGGTEGRDLPDASSLCGACSEACPVGIPLADMLVRLRADLRRPGPVVAPAPPGRARMTARRAGFSAWARLWASPAGYRLSTAAARRLSRLTPGGLARRAPLVRGWAEGRDLPLPARRSFRSHWAARGQEPWS